MWRSHSRDRKRVLDEGNYIMYSETTGAIKNLAAPLKLQAVNSTGVSSLESRSKARKVKSDHKVFYKLA